MAEEQSYSMYMALWISSQNTWDPRTLRVDRNCQPWFRVMWNPIKAFLLWTPGGYGISLKFSESTSQFPLWLRSWWPHSSGGFLRVSANNWYRGRTSSKSNKAFHVQVQYYLWNLFQQLHSDCSEEGGSLVCPESKSQSSRFLLLCINFLFNRVHTFKSSQTEL